MVGRITPQWLADARAAVKKVPNAKNTNNTMSNSERDADEARSYAALGGPDGVRDLLRSIKEEGFEPFDFKAFLSGFPDLK